METYEKKKKQEVTDYIDYLQWHNREPHQEKSLIVTQRICLITIDGVNEFSAIRGKLWKKVSNLVLVVE